MKQSKTWLIITAVILFCLLVAYALSQWFSIPSKVPYSGENPKETGVKALYLLFEKRGKEVDVWESSYHELPESSQDTLFVIAPQTDAPSQDEVQKIENWVKKGNQLILLSPTESPWTKAFRFSGKPCEYSGTRSAVSPTNDPWLSQLQQIDWSTDQCIALDEQTEPYIIDEDDTLVATKKLGEGRILYSPDVEFVTNQKIDQEDHIAIPLSFVEEKSGTIWFDETVHPWPPRLLNPPANAYADSMEGRGERESEKSFFSLLRSDGWFFLLQVLIFVVLFLYARGKRFAAPRFEKVEEQRNALEYVDAMARWYHRSRLRKETLLVQHHELQQHILETFQLPKNISEQALHQHLEHYLGESYRQTYEELAKAIVSTVYSKRKISHASFIEWSVTMTQLRRELEQWRAMPQTSIESRP